MMNEIGVWNEIVNDFGIKIPRVVVSGRYAVVDSVKKIYVLTEDIVTLQTSEGYVSVLGSEIAVKMLCDERIELTGDFSGVEFIRPDREKRGGRNGRKDRGKERQRE